MPTDHRHALYWQTRDIFTHCGVHVDPVWKLGSDTVHVWDVTEGHRARVLFRFCVPGLTALDAWTAVYWRWLETVEVPF